MVHNCQPDHWASEKQRQTRYLALHVRGRFVLGNRIEVRPAPEPSVFSIAPDEPSLAADGGDGDFAGWSDLLSDDRLFS